MLIYVPLPFIARFIDDPAIEPALNNLFGDDSWKEAKGQAGKRAALILHRVFLEKVRKAAGFAASFEVDASAGKGWSGYTLYFGTGNVVGLERMKEAMWRVDTAGGTGFAYSDNPDQMTIFGSEPDLRQLEDQLRARFGTEEFTIEEAWRYTAIATGFAPRMHLKEKTLRVAEVADRLDARQPGNPKRRRGTYPDGTVLRFRPPASGAR